MSAKIAINGFGRIGRLTLRAMIERHRDDLNVVAINDMADLRTNAHLFRYDSTYGIFPGKVDIGEGVLQIDGQNIAVLNEKDPARLPWKQLGVDIAIESTGVFTDGAHVRAHLDAGAKKAIITAPATDEDITLVLGVNDSSYNPRKHHIVSNASCTTNCLAPVAKVLHDNFGIDLVMPELKNKLHGLSLRVPTSTVSVIDLVVDLRKSVSADIVNDALKAAANGVLNGILSYCDEPLVSSDFRGNAASSIIDALSTVVMEGKMTKVLSWYDNEWGYSCRVGDLATFMAEREL